MRRDQREVVLGANSSFRRSALVAIGGFDEEFEYYLDETDAACRLVDSGWLIAQVEGAHVHHKFLPSVLRNTERVVTNYYPVIKNRIYFGLVNGLAHHSVNSVIGEARQFIGKLAHDLDWAIGVGKATEADRTRFWLDVDRGWRDGLTRGFAAARRWPDPASLATPSSEFLTFPTLAQSPGRRCFCFLSQEHPPGPVGGVGRYVHALARGVAALGHQVHLVTRGAGFDRVDFEDGVWVRRVVESAEDGTAAGMLALPDRIARHATRIAREVRRVAERRPVAAVYAPIWDCEGFVLIEDGSFPVVLSLQTTLQFWLDSHPHHAADPQFMADFARPMLQVETRSLLEAPGVHAISTAIAREIETAYDVVLAPERTAVIPLGLADRTDSPAESPGPIPPGSIRLLFVGRLEARKGIDVLLAVAPRLLTRHPQVQLDIVGNDRLPGPDGRTYRNSFCAESTANPIRNRVHFHGEVSEARLSGFYAACDIPVTPSRFESFGLVLVEGMMFAKPVIGCRAGGMVEVVEDGVSGLLAEPGDALSLEHCLERLIVDPALQTQLGEAGRARFEQEFSVERMSQEVADLLCRVGGGAGQRLAA